MVEPTSLYPEQQQILVALKQLFTAVEAEVNKAMITPQIFHDILIHLEQTNEHFHRFEFVKILQEKVDTALSSLIESELNKRPNSDPLDVIPEVTDIIFNSAEFLELQESFCSTMQEVIDVMVEIYHDPIRWDVKTPRFKNKNYRSNDDLSSSSNQTGCMFFTSDQYLQIARNLDPGMPKHVRQNALSCLFKTAPGECEHWPAIRQGIMDGLGDDDYNFAEEALSLHAKLFNSGTSYSTGELYTSLSGHLIQHFQSSAVYHLQLSDGLDTSNKNTRCIMRRFMLLSIFQHDIPTFWIRCPERHMIQPITHTMELLSLPPVDRGTMMPIHYLALFDHKALWFRKWTHGCFTRQLAVTAMFSHTGIIQNAIQSVLSVIYPDVGDKDVYSSFTYTPYHIKYLQFLHSSNILMILIQYSGGRDLIKHCWGDEGVTSILVSLINIMCGSHTVFDQIDSSLNPTTLLSDLMKELIVSGEGGRRELTQTLPITTLMSPILNLVDVRCVQSACDILSMLCSYNVGSNMLITTMISHQQAPMSAASIVGKSCVELMSDPSKPLNSKKKAILSALLFLARQIYTAHDGLAEMMRFQLVTHVNEILTVSGDITPQPHSPVTDSTDDSEGCFEEVLIDNMLGFASTAKGMILLHQDDLLDQCVDYLYQRKCKRLQVSKTQKFGYGYMVSQIAALPPGLLALQQSGFVTQLVQNLWKLLENGGPPTPITVPLTQPPDPYFEGPSLKAMTSFLQVVISYDALYGVLTSPDQLIPLDPTLQRQPEPHYYQDIISRLIFINSPEKSQCLMSFETMQIFGLRILGVLLTCLDTLLYYEDTCNITKFLFKCQEETMIEEQFVVDEVTVERNRILVSSCVLGGPGEKVLPVRVSLDNMSEEYSYPFFTQLPVPIIYTPQPCKPVDGKEEVKLSMFLVDANSTNSGESWLDKVRSFASAACRMPSFNGHVGLIEVVLKYQLQNAATFTKISSNKTDHPKIHGLDYGCGLLLDYGKRLGLLAPDTAVHVLSGLCHQVAAGLHSQCHKNGTKQAPRFDWFVGVSFLLFGGDCERTLSFLTSFSSTLTSGYLWALRLVNSSFIPQQIASSGVSVVHYKAGHSVGRVLQHALPMIASAFRMAGLSPSHIIKRWVSSCFLNVLPWREICNYILIVVAEGPVYNVLFCVAVLKHIKMRLLEHSTHHRLLYNILEEPVEGFHLYDHLEYMTKLQIKYGDLLLEDLKDLKTC